jgi:hypothetical protein
MANVAQYKNLYLESGEITSISVNKSFQIVSTDTMSLYEITQAGTIKATKIKISAEIRNNADTRFDAWNNLIFSKPSETLILLNRNWGNFFLESLDVNVSDLSPDGGILLMKMDLSFTQVVDFS